MEPYTCVVHTRGYEVDTSRTVTLPVLFSYLENLRWIWMSDPVWGLRPVIDQGCFFVVRRQTLEVVRRVGMGVAVQVRGVVAEVGRSHLVVAHDLVRVADGALLAHARVVGVLLGPHRGITRIPDETRAVGRAHAASVARIGAENDAPDPVGSDTSWLSPPVIRHARRGLDFGPPDAVPGGAHTAVVVVRPSDCDGFGHVNASTWCRYVFDARAPYAPGALSSRMSIAYEAEAVPGDQLIVRVWPQDAPGVWGAVIQRGDQVLVRARVDDDTEK